MQRQKQRIRIKRILPKLHHHINLLHSDQGTYFYKSHSLSSPNSLLRTIPLVLPALALLLVIGTLLNPNVSPSNSAYATDEVTGVTDTPASQSELSPSLSLAMPGHENEETINLQKQVDENTNKGYLAIDFNVIATNIDKYDVYVQSATSALIGSANGGKIESIISDTDYANLTSRGWGYSVVKGQQDPTTLTYKPIQTTVNTSADTGTAKDTTITQPYTLAFAANLSGATADHYQSDVILSVAAGANQVATLYSVTYNTNGSTSGTTPPTQTAQSDNPTYGFTAPTAAQYELAKEGHIFLGWAESPTTTTPQYLPNDTIILTTDNPNKTLYAIWKAATTPFPGYTYMQEPGLKDYCMDSSTAEGTTGQLVDGRDGKIYWVTIIKGTCWMTQDLDYDLNGQALTTKNDGDNLYKGSDADWDGRNADGNIVTSSSTGWTKSDYTTVNWWERDTTHGTEYTSLGNLYSYEAATAGTGNNVTSDNVEVPGSICPAGWKLPIGYTSTATGSFNGLGLTTSNVTDSPYYFQKGAAINGSFGDAGSSGYYWSATSYSGTNAYRLFFNDSSVAPTNSDARFLGYSVRCVVR